ncbi:MAG: hemolysin III family protein [Beijerinckiaceae bacterium]
MTLPSGHPRLSKRPFSLEELLADGIVHAVALIAGLIAFAVLIAKVATTGDFGRTASVAIYAAGFFLMFGFSLAYNVTPPSTLKWLLRRFDHASIYIMIAGTYTALLATGAAGEWGALLLGLVWIGAAGGVAIKFIFPGRLDRLSILFFLVLGGAGVVALGPLSQGLPGASFVLVLAGGATYVIGIGFYLWKSLQFQNAIWHCFVASASALHFAAVASAA